MWQAQRGRAAWSRVRQPRVSTSAVSLGVHGHARPLIAWRAGCSCPQRLWPPALGGGPSTRLTTASVPRRRLAAAEALGAAGWEASMRVPSVCAASGCSERVQFLPWDTACYVCMMRRARCLQMYCATIRRDPQGGMDFWLRPIRVSPP
jgi:hypothetical protein